MALNILVNPKLSMPILASILILGAFTIGFSFDDVFAGKDDNNGNNGCEKSNPNSKACEKNPNTTQERTLTIFYHDEDDNPISDASCAVVPLNGESDNVFGTTGSDGLFTATLPLSVTLIQGSCTNGGTIDVICGLELTEEDQFFSLLEGVGSCGGGL